ncbi:DUF4440 domain-containing protein [Nonomuraea sp. SMC257]|uniref:DUF4440 domain-containing protein n=1 Tax=Nonomuraea montanisoli TaxID=2741721 RepID=A0A7Y6M3Z3_9ACTN|nr:DUF4440 domain-containing protein [Nonomuraea montanisoli]NUW32960.1 DUF4440 domain-containing protein [Nonomuraea montanisoli]
MTRHGAHGTDEAHAARAEEAREDVIPEKLVRAEEARGDVMPVRAEEARRDVMPVRAEEARRDVMLEELVPAEVVRHHEVIGRWLAGTAPGEAFEEFARAHAPSFTLAAPDGRLMSRAEVLAEVEAAHGRVPGARIEIRHVTVVAAAGSLVVAAYEEWQQGAGRRSTVVFERGPSDRLSWLHLHETPLGGSGAE